MVTFRNPVVRIWTSVARLADGSELSFRTKLRTSTWTIEDARRRPLLTIENGPDDEHPSAIAHVIGQHLPLAIVIALVVGH